MKKIRSKAPLRLGLAGGGSDVSPYSDEYGGYILNATISLYSYCTIEEIEEPKIIINSVDLNLNESFNISTKYFPIDGNLDLIKQVLNHLLQNKYIIEFTPFKLSTYCDAPPGTGLGTSSTMVVAILKVFSEWKKLSLSQYDIAKIAYKIEREDLKLSGGKQDQYAASFGGFNFMEFYPDNVVLVNSLKINNSTINELNTSMLIFNLGSSRSSANIIDEQKKSLKNNNTSLEAMHKIKKHAKEMKDALISGEFYKIAKILNESWEMKKLLSNKISNERIDLVYQTALMNGAIAGKISGAGGGGTIVLIIEPTKKFKIIQELSKLNCKHVDFVFTNEGASSWQINKL